MKLLFCPQCHDVVQMRMETRACLCGASRGRYLADRSTVEQTAGSLSLALHNHDFAQAREVYAQNTESWSPFFVMRAYLNPTREDDVRWVAEVSDGVAEAPADDAGDATPPTGSPAAEG